VSRVDEFRAKISIYIYIYIVAFLPLTGRKETYFLIKESILLLKIV
jgi:hypothetical protein